MAHRLLCPEYDFQRGHAMSRDSIRPILLLRRRLGDAVLSLACTFGRRGGRGANEARPADEARSADEAHGVGGCQTIHGAMPEPEWLRRARTILP